MDSLEAITPIETHNIKSAMKTRSMIPEVRSTMRPNTGYKDKGGGEVTVWIDDGGQVWCPNPYCLNTMVYVGNPVATPDVTLLCQKCGTAIDKSTVFICKLRGEC